MTRYRFIDANRVEVGVRRCCRAVDVSPSGFYDLHRRVRRPGPRARADGWLLGEIGRIHGESGGAYGAPRMHAELQIACGVRVGRKRVARLMRAAGLVGCHRRRHHPKGLTRRDPKAVAAPDLVKRQFSPPRPDRIWHGDDTELPTEEGKLYLAVLLDGCSRLVVGHAVSTRLEALGIRASMGSVGCCFDHALVESFNATLECELIDRRRWRTRADARLEVFYWIEAVYNRRRRHSALGYLSPAEYEAKLTMTPTMSNPST